MDATAKHRLLVVDDDASVLLTYQLLLQEQGYEVNAAISSKKAKEELRRSNFDVVLCDLSLEQDRTGFEVFEFARQMYPAIPCVLLTGYANKEATDRAEVGGIEVLFKPIEIEEFLQTIRTVLKNRHAKKKSTEL
jgi:DNA-binding NtrC family response regulator